MGPHITKDCPGKSQPAEWWQTPEDWQTWPGAHLPEIAHPPGTHYSNHDHVPMYPGGTTCNMLCERDPYFPMDWSLALLILTAILIYIVWPLYVLRHLIRKVDIPDHCMSEAHADYRSLSTVTTNASSPITRPTGPRWEPPARARARRRRTESRTS